MFFMNFWYIEHYAASFGDDFYAKWSNSNISNGFHELLVHKHYGARVEVIFLLIITNLKYQMDIQLLIEQLMHSHHKNYFSKA